MKRLFLLLPILLVFIAYTSVEAQKPQSSEKNYIVVLKDNTNVDQVAREMSVSHKFTYVEKYDRGLKGYTAKLSTKNVAGIKKDSRVKFVSEDRVVTSTAQVIPTGINRVNAIANPNKGSGIGVAVVDTGIQLSHPDLAANIVANTTCIRRTYSGNDDNGHGTHVAGTIAALGNTVGVVGVAPQVKLIAVKVLDRRGSGTWSNVICGLNWVIAHAPTYNIKVINLSLGGSGLSDNNCGNTNFDALHQAICKARDAGITVVVAAGNSASNAATFVPAAYDDSVITVSALADSNGVSGGLGAATAYGADDTFASFSNYGSVVDIAAPGVNIYSTYKGSNYTSLSGTSMATPHVSAAAALYIKNHSGVTWSQIRDALITAGEPLGSGHNDPSGKHPEPVLNAASL